MSAVDMGHRTEATSCLVLVGHTDNGIGVEPIANTEGWDSETGVAENRYSKMAQKKHIYRKEDFLWRYEQRK
jgi:hypothetical protein